MTLTQTWVGYVDRSYEQIKKSLLSRITVQAPEITDHSESNPLIIIVSMFAGVAEVIHLYLDAIAREAFLGTARKYASVVKLVKLIDYNIKARSTATVDELFFLVDGSGNPITHTEAITVPKGLIVYPINSNIPFRLLEDVVIPPGYTSRYGRMEQFTQVLGEGIGVTSATSDPSQSFLLSPKYVHNSLVVTINGENWPLYNSFGLMGPTTKGAVVQVLENAEAVVVFGDGVNGAIPPAAQNIFADYKDTEGLLGNLPPNSLTEIQTAIILPTGVNLKATNGDYSSGGANFQNIDQIRDLAPRSLRTLDRAVTYQDYIDIAMQVPGVGAAEAKYCCGKYVDVYIAPNSPGTATTALISKVQQYMDCRVMVTTIADVKPSGTSRVWIKATIIGKPLFTEAQVKNQVITALDDNFGIGTVEINRRVSITDIITVLEQLSMVDTVEIEELRIEPYARPIEETNNILNITFTQLPNSTTREIYKLVYKTATNDFELYKNGVYVDQVAISVPYNDAGIIGFTVNPGVYDDNDSFEFVVFPSYPEIFPTTLILVNDYSAPIIEVSPFIDEDTERTIFSDLTIEVTGQSSSCLPPCS